MAACFLAVVGLFCLAIGIATTALLGVGTGVFEVLTGSALLFLVIRAYRADDRRLGPTSWRGLFWDAVASMALLIVLTTNFVIAFIRYHSWVSVALAAVFAAGMLRSVRQPLIYLANWRGGAPEATDRRDLRSTSHKHEPDKL